MIISQYRLILEDIPASLNPKNFSYHHCSMSEDVDYITTRNQSKQKELT
jgi:hypothetical protein